MKRIQSSTPSANHDWPTLSANYGWPGHSPFVNVQLRQGLSEVAWGAETRNKKVLPECARNPTFMTEPLASIHPNATVKPVDAPYNSSQDSVAQTGTYFLLSSGNPIGHLTCSKRPTQLCVKTPRA